MFVARVDLAIGCVLIVGVIAAWQLARGNGDNRLQASRPNGGVSRDSVRVLATDSGRTQSSPPLVELAPKEPVSAAAKESNAALDARPLIDELVRLVEKRELSPSQVGTFDAVTESELIHRYQTSRSPREKGDLAALMAYGGSSSSVALFTNVLLQEFAGKPLDAEEVALVRSLPICLGILASREDTALQFLLSGVHGKLNLRQPAWETGEYKLEARVLRGGFWHGLAWSGRPEARKLLTKVLAGQGLDLITNVESSLQSSAFYLWIVESRGVDEMVRLSRDHPGRLEEYRQWLQATEEGRAWDEWLHAHSPHVRPGTRPTTVRRP